jgi:hypothetical protein
MLIKIPDYYLLSPGLKSSTFDLSGVEAQITIPFESNSYFKIQSNYFNNKHNEITGNWTRLEVRGNYHKSLHIFQLDEFLEARSYLSDLAIAKVDLFAPQILRFWVLPGLNDTSDAKVKLRKFLDSCCSCF